MSKILIKYHRPRKTGDRDADPAGTDFRVVVDFSDKKQPVRVHEVKTTDGLGDVSWRKIAGDSNCVDANVLLAMALERLADIYAAQESGKPATMRELASVLVPHEDQRLALVIDLGAVWS